MAPPAVAPEVPKDSLVVVTGGRHKGARCRVDGETEEFYRVRHEHASSSSATAATTPKLDFHRVKKCHVQRIPDQEQSTPHVQSQVVEPDAAVINLPSVPEQDSTPTPNISSSSSSSSSSSCSSSSESSPVAPSQSRRATLGSHTLRIVSWNTCKLSFLGKQDDSSLVELVQDAANVIAATEADVVVLQEVPKKVGPARVCALREKLNEALQRQGNGIDRLYGEPIFSCETAGAREIYALLLRPPVQFDCMHTLKTSGGMSFTYPPLLALLRDNRFSFPASRQIMLATVHTPGSEDDERRLQRAKEVNQLLTKLQVEAPAHLRAENPETLRFKDKRMRKKVDSREACAAPFVLCGDLNTDFFKVNCGVKAPALETFKHGLEITVMKSTNLAELSTSNGIWVAGAPPGRVTSGAGRCLDFFMWNADAAKRMGFLVRPLHLSQDGLKRRGHQGLSDHDMIMLEMHEDNLHSFQERATVQQVLEATVTA